jgi:hypothetical protein
MVAGKSKLLIADSVTDELDTSVMRATWDIAICLILGGTERTESQWLRLLESSHGKLKLNKIWKDLADTEHVLEVEKVTE